MKSIISIQKHFLDVNTFFTFPPNFLTTQPGTLCHFYRSWISHLCPPERTQMGDRLRFKGRNEAGLDIRRESVVQYIHIFIL